MLRNKNLLLHDVGWGFCGQPVTALFCQTFILMHFPSLSKDLSHRLQSLSSPQLMVSSWLRCGCFLYCGLLHKLWGLLAPEFEVSSCLVLQPYWLCAAGSPCMCCLLSFFNTVRQRLSCPLWWGHCGTIWNHPNRLCQAHGSPGLQSQRLHLCFLLPVSPWRPITRCLTELVPALHQSQAALRYLVWGITTAKMPVLSVAVQQELTDVCD